jgi:ribokinase
MNPKSSVRICVVGSSNVDLTFRTIRMPHIGETLAAHGFQLAFGGKGANQAVTAARLGANVAFVARVGNDAFGQESLKHLRADGLDTSHVRVDSARPTGTAAIIVDDAARNCILIVSGANASLSPQDIRDAAPAIQAANVLLCQLEVPLKTSLEAFRIARAAGVRTILTPAPAVPLPDEMFPLIDLLIPNETEIELLTGRRTDSAEELEKAARLLRKRGAKVVAVTLGERGILLLDDDGPTRIPAIPVTAVDPTGAGDAFTGSLAVFWAEGQTLRDAARKAAAVAALTVTRLGTQTAFPSRVEVEAFWSGAGDGFQDNTKYNG